MDYLIWGSAFFPNIVMNLVKNSRVKNKAEHAKEVWDRNSRHDS